MNFKISRYHLLNALNKVSKAISIKTPVPALTGIKFDLTHDLLTLTGSDSDITIQTYIQAKPMELEVFEPGSIILSGKYIMEIIRKLDSEFVQFEIVDGTLIEIQGDLAQFSLNGIRSTEYPRIDFSKTGQSFMLDSILFKQLIQRTIFATSDKETRPILTGLNFKASNGQLECTGTDSYRLAREVIDLNQDIQFNATIPSESLKKVSQIIEKEEDLEITISDRKILICMSNVIILSRLIDGVYPDTSHLIPTSFDHLLKVDSKELMNAIDRASLISSEISHVVTLELAQDTITLSSKSQEIGSVRETIKGDYQGPGLTIAFSSRFVIEALKAINSLDVEVSFTQDMKPFIIKNPNETSMTQLILPVRVV